MSDKNSTTRFSNRVSDYIKYRPQYPSDIVDFLKRSYGITTQDIIADVGAGTGISSHLFLEREYRVIAVEPNKEMRDAAIAALQHFDGFSTLTGTAERTLLTDNSVDVVVAAQAFHWFDMVAVRAEFKRVLKSNGLVVLIWNERLMRTSFEQEYDALITRHATDYIKVDHRNIDDESIQRFFAPNLCELKVFPNQQVFDFNGLKGRLMSSSYMPGAGDPGFDDMIADLKQLFNRYQEHDAIVIHYDTKVYTGRLDL